MRNIHLILFLVVFICINLVCKDISGYYYSRFCEPGFNIDFKNDTNFEYEIRSEFSRACGKGIYILNDSTLTLNFSSEDTLKPDLLIEEISCNCKNNHNLTIEFFDKISLMPRTLSSFFIIYQAINFKTLTKRYYPIESKNDTIVSNMNIKTPKIDIVFNQINKDSLNTNNINLLIPDSLYNYNLFLLNIFDYYSFNVKLGSKNCKKIKLNIAEVKNFIGLFPMQIIYKYEFLKKPISLKKFKKKAYPGYYNFDKNVRMYDVSVSFLDE